MNLLERIEQLTRLRGGPGFEGDVVAVMSSEMQRLGAQVQVDAMGNVIGRLGAGDQKYSVMVCAHTDEVGLIVKYVDEDGFIYFDTNGMVNTAVLPATPVDICTDAGVVPGVIAARSRHLLSQEEMAAAPNLDDLWIEVGARNAAEVRTLGIQIGDSIVYQPNFRHLGNGYFTSKSIDNRAGCAILLSLIEQLRDKPLGYDLIVAACVQEEIGSRGAAVVAQTVQPLLAIVLDTVPAGEPVTPRRRAPVAVGGGPVIRSADTLPTLLGTIYNRNIRRRLVKTAEQLGMNYQLDVARTWTDAATIHTAGRGVPSGGVFIPRRGSHSPAEVACLTDVERTLLLLHAFLTDLPVEEIASLIAPPTVL